MLSETILEMPYCQLNLGKNKLEILPLGGRGEELGAYSHTWDHWPKIKKAKN